MIWLQKYIYTANVILNYIFKWIISRLRILNIAPLCWLVHIWIIVTVFSEKYIDKMEHIQLIGKFNL